MLQTLKVLVLQLVTSPLNLLLLALCVYLLYKIFGVKKSSAKPSEDEKEQKLIPKMKRRDFTVNELSAYNGVSNIDKRILVAVNQKVFDVTNKGKDMYGPDAPYAAFAGRDASRALATFSLDASTLRDGYDALSDLTAEQIESLNEWDLQFTEKYDKVGKLLKPNELPTEYSDSDSDSMPESVPDTDDLLLTRKRIKHRMEKQRG